MSRVSQAFVVAALVAVAACASKPKIVAQAPSPPAPIVPIYVAPPVSPINRGLSTAGTVWHMRAALNVAALACRGAQEGAIIQRYNAMLTAHKATLAGAQTTLSAEFKARGGDWQDRYDDTMTRLYNFFSQAQARDAFCTAAAATLAETETLAPGELQAFAAAVLPTLDAPFAEMLAPRPVIALASSGIGMVAPMVTPAVGPRAVVAPPVTTRAPVVTARAVAMPPAAVGTRAASDSAGPAMRTPMPVVGTRGVVVATPVPVATKHVPRLELDLSDLPEQ
jgi:hypothetical protein